MSTLVSARVTIPGLHRWPDAPPARRYLASEHRHLFWVTATVRVDHDDRAVEFHDLQAWLGDALGSIGYPYAADRHLRQFGERSCETLAREVADYLRAAGLTVAAMEVSEDGECAARLTWTEE